MSKMPLEVRSLVFALAIAVTPLTAHATPLNYAIPEDTTQLKPGPNRDVAQNNCMACHSADYIQAQPKGAKFGKDFWQAEVTKMIKVYGAPIDDADVSKIVDYLTAAYSQ